ncbi:Nucleotide-binding, alpha-beta plait, partial [Cynara cardunculus var. scolymus]
MQSDLGKLFIGGISWDTNEERLHEYFSRFGEVLESVIMKDRATGRARGFGFIVFADPAVAERVIKEKHNIDGRMVEAKKAVPRDDQTTVSRNSSSLSVKGSPGFGQTRKIFVGGLASGVTESDFKRYFEQFGTISDVVVMYDHNTKRPRGFGFVTYESEDSIGKVLLKTFHQLDGKMVEVKRAVPKELSPGLSRSPISPYPYGLSQASSILNGYPNPIGGYDVRMDRTRSGHATYGSGFGMGLNFEPTTSGNYGNGVNYNNPLSYRGLSPYYVGNSSRFASPVGFDGGDGGNLSLFSSNPRNLWGNGGISSVGSGSGVIGGRLLGNAALNLGGISPVSPQDGGGAAQSGNLGGLGGGEYGRNTSGRGSYEVANGGYDVPSSDFYGCSVYGGDPTWPSEQEGSGPFGVYGLAGTGLDGQMKSSHGYVG